MPRFSYRVNPSRVELPWPVFTSALSPTRPRAADSCFGRRRARRRSPTSRLRRPLCSSYFVKREATSLAGRRSVSHKGQAGPTFRRSEVATCVYLCSSATNSPADAPCLLPRSWRTGGLCPAVAGHLHCGHGANRRRRPQRSRPRAPAGFCLRREQRCADRRHAAGARPQDARPTLADTLAPRRTRSSCPSRLGSRAGMEPKLDAVKRLRASVF